MNQNENIKRLHEPFHYEDVEWKIQATNQEKTKGLAIAYINKCAIQTRLDEVVGAANWKNTYSPWQNNAQLCGLSIYDNERGEWVTKYDGAENTDYEPVKGGLSDSFKRAACVWGIGRYLRDISGIWVEIEQKGKSSIIKNNEYTKLEAEYNKAISRIFGVSKEKTKTATVEKKTAPSAAATSSDYTVKSVTPSGKESLKVELVNISGEVVSAFIKKDSNNVKTIKTGSKLKGVNIAVKNGNYGPYNVIDDYKIAA